MIHFKRFFTIALCAGFIGGVIALIAYFIMAAAMWQFDIGYMFGVVRLLGACGAVFGVILGITVCVKEGEDL